MNTYSITRAINKVRIWGFSLVGLTLLVANMVFVIPNFKWIIGGALLIVFSMCEAFAIAVSEATGRYVKPYDD